MEITIRFFKFVWEILPIQPTIQPRAVVLLGVIYLVPRGSVIANDGAVTYYAQYGRTPHARAAAEPRNHMVGTVDCDFRRAFGSVRTI